MENKIKYGSLDITSEVFEKNSQDIRRESYVQSGVMVEQIEVLNPNNEYQKKVGKYIKIEGKKHSISDLQSETIKAMTKVLKQMINGICDKKLPTVLIIGLGNEDYSPDSLGPKVLDNVYVTNHLESSFFKMFRAKTCCFAPSVMSKTGLESANMVKSIVKDMKVDFVIAIDALATRSIKRLNKVIQITDTGVTPGSGVGNFRKTLNSQLLGIPVIAIGVATVVDSYSLVKDVLEELNSDVNEKKLNKVLEHLGADLILTTKEIDSSIYDLVNIIANSINKALHD